MNFFEKIIFALQAEMKEPEVFGWFHLLCLGVMIGCIVFLYARRSGYGERQLKTVVGVYGFTTLALELLKQIVWSFNYDPILNVVTWDYQWYAAPFQLCTTPLYVSLIVFFMKDCEMRKSLMAYMSFVTILGSIATIFMPEQCFVDTILVNIHTTWLHYGSFVVSVYLLMSGAVEFTMKSLNGALKVFVVFVTAATILNVGVYNSGVLNGEVFNMFYISPYFVSELPVFDKIQQAVPYPIFVLTYICALSLGSAIVLVVAKEAHCLFGHKSSGSRTHGRRLGLGWG